MKKIALLFVALITLSFTKINNDTVKFKATVENRNSDTLVIRSRTFNKIIVSNKEGVFTDEFQIEEGFYQLFDGAEYAKLYLKNGYDLTMFLNAEKFDESIKFEGNGSNENNFLAEMALDDEKFDYAGMLQASENDFPNLLEKRKDYTLSKLDSKELEKSFVDAYKIQFEQSMVGLQAYYNESLKVRKLNGQQSPTFNFENHKGGTTKLEDFKGRYVYVDVWATWCEVACRDSSFKEIRRTLSW